jgi:hypothetical protein
MGLYLPWQLPKVRELLPDLMLIARFPAARVALLGIFLAGVLASPVRALEKEGMPDLAQEEQTCLPTSTANIIVWFGLHGYPKLIQPGDSKEDGYIHTVHRIMDSTDASYQMGTRTEAITYGIAKYIHDAGYGCDVEYRGLDWSQAKFPNNIVDDKQANKYKAFQKTPVPFTQDWLQGNNDANKAFLLLLAYVTFDRGTNTFHDAINAGHAVTLVNAEPDMILIHDPAHYGDEPGRKILTPEVLTGGSFQLPGYAAPVSGLMLLSGSLLDGPEDSMILLTGSVCVTMHPINDNSTIIASAAGAPNSVISGNKGPAAPASAPASTSKPSTPATTSWGMWIFNLLFSK